MTCAALLFLAGCAGEETETATPVSAHGDGPPTLFFAASQGGGSWDIWVEDVRSGERTNLTRTPRGEGDSGDDYSLAVSPDAELVAYMSGVERSSDALFEEEIFVMERDGSGETRLTDDGRLDGSPAWTPEGRIVFVSCPLAGDELPDCRLDAIAPDGSSRETLLEGLGFTFAAAVSADGTKVAYSRFDGSLSPVGVFVRDLGGADDPPIADGWGPQWSPDGERIAFVSDRDRNGRCLFRECRGDAPELYVMEADGSGQRRLTETTAEEGDASWTPDGEWVLFTRSAGEEDDFDVFAIRPDGGCEIQLTDTKAWEWSPIWLGPSDSLSC